jgi:hypothetical protein
LYLAVPFSKVNILTNVPFYLVTIAVIFISKRTDWFTRLAPVADLYRRYPVVARRASRSSAVCVCSPSPVSVGPCHRRRGPSALTMRRRSARTVG